MADTNAHVPETESTEPQAEAALAEPVASSDPTEALAREAADLKDRLLRALAEMENMRRRNDREVADARAYGNAAFARDLLTVADNMRRALDAFGPDVREGADAGVKALVDGVELTERELGKVLEKHGVKKLEPQGSKFDPNLHQAMYEVADASVPPGTVVQVVQSGYTIGDRVLRPALVAVAKGGQKPAQEAPANDNAGNDAAPPSN